MQLVGANQTGPIFVVDGTGDFQFSDSISFAGVESVNPQTLEPTGQLLRLPCIGIKNGLLQTASALIVEGQYRNASRLPANGAQVINNGALEDSQAGIGNLKNCKTSEQ